MNFEPDKETDEETKKLLVGAKNIIINSKARELKMKEVIYSLVNLDLPGCFYGPERCGACKSGLKGSSSHTRSGVQYYTHHL